MDKLVLIDGNSLLNRAFYATPIFATKDGRPTNAIFGFVKLLFKIISDESPEYIIVTFDVHAPTFRHKMYEGYKATRSPMPEALVAQVKPLKSLLEAMNIAMCEKEGLEADDLLGTLSARFDVHSYIYTGDRDSFQLVDDKTSVCYTKRGVTDLLRLDIDNFSEVTKLKPQQIIDLKSLMGDKSDNIPGVPGIGEKSARDLLEQFGSLDGIYGNLYNVKSQSLRKKLIDGKDSAYLSYDLARIRRDSDININLENCVTPKEFSSDVREMFIELEFKSLLPQLATVSGDDSREIEQTYPDIVEINSIKALEEVCAKNGTFYLYLRENGASMYSDGVYYEIIFDAADLFCIFDEGQMYDCLSKIFENSDNTVITYDYKLLLHNLKSHGVALPVCCVEDISLMGYVADDIMKVKNVEELCKSKGYDEKYIAYDLFHIYAEYQEKLKNIDGLKIYKELELPLTVALYDMEDFGVVVDKRQLEAIGKNYQTEIDELTTKIYDLCDCKFNINSPSQLGEVLFEKLNLKTGKKGKTGKYSTNADILGSLQGEHEVIGYILKYRLYQKLYSTYIEGLRHVLGGSDIVHTTYNQAVTSTGRLSSANPNLQNIPIREEEGRELRKIFISRQGNVLIDADYSQIELRLLAHFSGCKELIEAYKSDKDVHNLTASQVFGVPVEEVTPKMRREAKAVNFGIIYGISEFGLAKNIGTDITTAKNYIDSYFRHYPGIKEYMQQCVHYAQTHGYICTLSGRKRSIPEINSANYNLRQFGERAAMNMPLQGSSADIIKIAMVNIYRRLKVEKMTTKLILQVHDELVLDAPVEEQEKATEILKFEMENAVELKVPLKIDVHAGKNLYEAK